MRDGQQGEEEEQEVDVTAPASKGKRKTEEDNKQVSMNHCFVKK